MTALAVALAKATIVIALGLAVMPLLRRRSAALRHWILVTAVISAAALPLLTMMAPRWTAPAAFFDAPRFTTETSLVFSTADAATMIVPASGLPRDHVSPAADVADWLAGIWLCGAAIGLAAIGLAMHRLVRLTSTARAANALWCSTAAEVGAALGIVRLVRVLVSERHALLVTWGVRQPVILLPADADAWPADRVRAVVGHELAHVQRKDWMTQLTVEIVRACVWFHPLVWVACGRIRAESERASDDLVLGLGIERTAYASHLVALARAFKAHRRTWLPAPAIARPSTLQWRIRAMLNTTLDRRPVSASTRAGLLATMLVASLTFAGLHAQTTQVAGTLHDATGRVLPEATVRLVHQETRATYEMQADRSGRFGFTAVAPGDYVLSARTMGFAPAIETFSVAAGDSVQRDLTLQVSSLQETISVRGGGPVADSPKRGPQEVPMPAAPSCTPTAAGGNIVPPMKIRNVPPHYPQGLQDAKVTGTVLLLARVGVDGLVNDVRPLSHGGDSGLEEAAMIAVKQWRFTPTLLNCQAIEVQFLATVTFSLAQ